MLPVSIMKNGIERVGVDSKLFGDHYSVASYPGRSANIFGKQCSHHFLGELGPMMSISFQLPPLQNHVGFVGGVIPKEEVVGSDTVSNITFVQNPHPGWNWPIVNNPGGPVRSLKHAFNAAPKYAIPFVVFPSGP